MEDIHLMAQWSLWSTVFLLAPHLSPGLSYFYFILPLLISLTVPPLSLSSPLPSFLHSLLIFFLFDFLLHTLFTAHDPSQPWWRPQLSPHFHLTFPLTCLLLYSHPQLHPCPLEKTAACLLPPCFPSHLHPCPIFTWPDAVAGKGKDSNSNAMLVVNAYQYILCAHLRWWTESKYFCAN